MYVKGFYYTYKTGVINLIRIKTGEIKAGKAAQILRFARLFYSIYNLITY
ncbi:translation elongation factor EF-4 [Chitinophaga sp. W3I9]